MKRPSLCVHVSGRLEAMTEDTDASNNAALERLATGLALSHKPENSSVASDEIGQELLGLRPRQETRVPRGLSVLTVHSVTSQ